MCRRKTSPWQDEAGTAAGSPNLEGTTGPEFRELVIDRNLPRTMSQHVHTGVEGAALQRYMPTIEEADGEGDQEDVSA